MAVSSNKLDQINIRINTKDKEMLEKASAFNHLSLSAYIISTCLKQASLDLKQSEILNLDKEQFEYIVKLLSNSPKPTKELIKLFK